MKLDFIPLDKLSVSKTNMRYAKKAPDVSDILPTIRKRGVIQPLIVRPNPCPERVEGCADGAFEIVGGARRFHAAKIVAAECEATSSEIALLPCAILDDGDDADAIEASLIENIARLDPDEVTQWETFTRLVKEGRLPDDISATFGLPENMVRRILALGNLLPRIRELYRAEEIDASTVRHLTMASKSQQKAWVSLFDDPDSYVPTGHQLKAWLFGGQSIKAEHALFDLATFTGTLISDLFGEDRYFADADQFWEAQNAAIEERRETYLDAGWADVIVVQPSDHFHSWEYEKAAKRKGGRVYIDVRSSGEVSFHEGYISHKEARRLAKGEPAIGQKAARPEVTSTCQTYIDLHRHAAVRAALTGHPGVALRLMVAHAIAGSQLWTLRPEPQSTRNDAVRESVETCKGEADFDAKRRAVLELLGFSAEEPTVTGGNGDHDLAAIFTRLLDLSERAVMDILCIVIGETLAVGSAAVEAVGLHIGVDMADYWSADEAFLSLLRDREVLTRLLADVASETIAQANRSEKAKVMKQVLRDHVEGTNGRKQVTGWVPRWMAFPARSYTARGGNGTSLIPTAPPCATRPEDDLARAA